MHFLRSLKQVRKGFFVLNLLIYVLNTLLLNVNSVIHYVGAYMNIAWVLFAFFVYLGLTIISLVLHKAKIV